MGAKVLQHEIAAYGGSGIPMDATEVYTALQNGTIDGVGSSYMFFYQAKLCEVGKYIFDEPRAAELSICAVSKVWLETLPEDLQQVVYESCEEARALSLAYEKDAATRAIDLMNKEFGVTLISVSDQERQRLIDASKKVHEQFLADNPDTVDIYDSLLKEIEAKRK